MPRTSPDKRLDDHSKRLAALEQAQVYFSNEQRHIKETLDRIRDYLFGSTNPNEESAKEQLRVIQKTLKAILERQEKEELETHTIRKDGFTRLEILERQVGEQSENKQQAHEVKLVGIKMSAELRGSIISGLISGIFMVAVVLLSR